MLKYNWFDDYHKSINNVWDIVSLDILQHTSIPILIAVMALNIIFTWLEVAYSLGCIDNKIKCTIK